MYEDDQLRNNISECRYQTIYANIHCSGNRIEAEKRSLLWSTILIQAFLQISEISLFG